MESCEAWYMDSDGFPARSSAHPFNAVPRTVLDVQRKPCGTTRVLLAHGHRMVREALRALLERHGGSRIAVVAEADGGEAVLERVAHSLPDIVVMEIGLPQPNGSEIARRLLKSCPSAKVIALAAHADRHVILGMLEAGVSGYIVTTAAGEELARAVEKVIGGELYLCSVATAILIGAAQSRGHDKSVLGRRETEVLKLLAQGLRTPEIGRRLHISASTVEVHRRNIMRKLALHSVVDLTKYAIREGLVPI